MSFLFFPRESKCFATGRKKAAKETQEGCLSLWIRSVCAGGGNVGPGRAAGPDGADIRRMSFLFFPAHVFCGSIPLGCCFSFLLALFI